MKQPALDLFVSETVPPTQKWSEPAPIAPSVDLTARHCSSMGAIHVEKTRENLWALMRALYAVEPRTDAELANLLHVAPSTISARRNELIAQKVVAEESCGTRKNQKTGISNTLWKLK